MIKVQDILDKARAEINSQSDIDITDWIQALALIDKIITRVNNRPFKGGSSVCLWWIKEDQREMEHK